MTRLILIRHGETDYTSQGRYCGFSDPSLNHRGVQQSESLVIKLKEARIDKVYSSDLKRAYESAKIIFNPSTTLRVNGERSRNIKNNSVEEIADFREINFGLFEGLRYEEIIKVYPKLYWEWIDNPLRVKIPSGEGLVELEKRVKEKLSLILSQDAGKVIALVSHGGPIRVILCHLLKLGLESFWKVEQGIGTLRIIDYPKGALV